MLFLTQDPIAMPLALIAFFGAYLSGSVPYGLILTRLAGIGDIRKEGSGNIGATNVLRVGGKKLAILTLLLDALKGTIPVLIAKQFHMDYAVLAAFGALIGHLFPIWLKFKGGKGVAVAVGIIFALSPLLGLSLVAIWLTVAIISKYSSLSALIACGLSPVLCGMITQDAQLTATIFVIALIIIAKHHENIRRLINGTESRINLKKKA